MDSSAQLHKKSRAVEPNTGICTRLESPPPLPPHQHQHQHQPARCSAPCAKSWSPTNCRSVPGSWCKPMRDVVRNKEWWKRRRAPTQDPSTDLQERAVHEKRALRHLAEPRSRKLLELQGKHRSEIVRPSRIPPLCTRSTHAGIEWFCCHRAVCMAWPR